MENKTYWDRQFERNKKIWGLHPSVTVEIAMKFFNVYSCESVLIPGVGYGRNSKVFTEAGYEITGVEVSSHACDIATEYDPKTKVICTSLQDMDVPVQLFDAIYCYDVLHLFLEDERLEFVSKCAAMVREEGLLFFAVLSEKDEYFGNGVEHEFNTFEVKPGKLIHFFTENDLALSFVDFKCLDSGELVDSVEHAEHGEKHYCIRYICVRKSSC
jgi:2-polyprenyl-3-methyl-5-hydroxy-6-metoxy-1,4-benzoquinol methylase